MSEFKIGKRKVGKKYPPLVIAEIGINHNGSLDLAIELADSAIRAGAEVIKHQTHIPSEEMSIEAKKIKPGNSNKSIYRIMEESALSESEERKLFQYVRSKKSIFISSPFSYAAADRLNKFGIPAFKVGSGECNNFHFIEYLCKFKKPIIMSTGMNSIASIRKSINIIRRKKIPLALLHCTNIYPTPFNLIRLGCIAELQSAYKDCVIGYSDHTVTNHTCLAAVSLGASIIEKHYVDSRTKRKGPDVVCSMDSNELKDLIAGSKNIFYDSGGKKLPIKEEKKTINFAFASVVSKIKIIAGEKLSKNNITLKRPSGGDFGIKDLNKLFGKFARIDIKENIQLKKKYLK
jgi:N-acetylneuraminate synthase